MNNVHIFDHPLIQHKMAVLRNKETKSHEFRQTVKELATLMAYEVTNDLQTKDIIVETPLGKAECKTVDEYNIVIIPILRAGLGMIEGLQSLLPSARVGHIGLARNEETKQPEAYYVKLPLDIDKAVCIVVDPMLATGGSAVDAIAYLKNCGAKQIKFVGLIGADAGIEHLNQAHPDVPIFLADRDKTLNDNAYIVPGLGDAGDRIFGTLE